MSSSFPGTYQRYDASDGSRKSEWRTCKIDGDRRPQCTTELRWIACPSNTLAFYLVLDGENIDYVHQTCSTFYLFFWLENCFFNTKPTLRIQNWLSPNFSITNLYLMKDDMIVLYTKIIPNSSFLMLLASWSNFFLFFFLNFSW